MNNIAFDSNKYVQLQSQKILERVNLFDNKLYLEFGGKLFDDFHAARVLPGYTPNIKVTMLNALKDKLEIVMVINANDIEKSKKRNDVGTTYDQEVLRLIDAFRGNDLLVNSVVITRYVNSAVVNNFIKQLKKVGIKTYRHYSIVGYPNNLDDIVSEDGFGKNEYVETTKPIVVVTAPGPGSGKMAVCLSQLYHEHKRGIKAGYAKYETFPIWNLPLTHPVNLAYEAATADLDDVNMIDPYHLEKYGIQTVNYNRDVESFPVLSRILKQIMGNEIYYSPTDMGVNMNGFCIINDEIARKASFEEIVRRYYWALTQEKKGQIDESVVRKLELIMNKAGISTSYRKCVKPALDKAEQTKGPAVALELPDGKIITGKTSALLGACGAALINSLKYICDIDDDKLLLSPNIIEPVQQLKVDYLGNNNPRLHIDEMLIALMISAQQDDQCKKAIDSLGKLKGSQLHSSVLLAEEDINTLRKLGVEVTCEPIYHTKKLFHKN